MQITIEPKIESFPSPAMFRTWLSRNYDRQEGIWLKLFKKNSGKNTLSHAEALDEAVESHLKKA